MEVFNLAEKLEEERKKNKELEKEIKQLRNAIYKDYIVEDLKNKNYWLKNDNEAYKERINKTIKYITSTKWVSVKEVLNILKGSDK